MKKENIENISIYTLQRRIYTIVITVIYNDSLSRSCPMCWPTPIPVWILYFMPKCQEILELDFLR